MNKESCTEGLTIPDVRVRRRLTKQDRSAARQNQIADGAIIAISRYGIAGLTHRRVAQEAHVSLAATTYYYQTKTDIIADASRKLLTQYVDAFHRYALRNADAPDKIAFRDFAMKLVFNAAGKQSVQSLAWCEIILNTAREPELRDLSQSWFAELNGVWTEIALLLGVPNNEQAVTSAIDTVIGFIFLVMPLSIEEDELRALLAGEADDIADRFHAPEGNALPVRTGRKAEETRERILNAAVEIIIDEGVAALGYRRVAEKCDLTIGAPAYHFASISALENAAQLRLFDQAKLRYRSVMGGVEYARLDVAQLADLTATVFLREVIEFRNASLASLPVYISSRRDPVLRPGLWAINTEMQHRWAQILQITIPNSTPFNAWVMYAAFIGKLIRILATGTETQMLAKIRSEFAYDIGAMAQGCHWSDPK